jgi:hypothetical protein
MNYLPWIIGSFLLFVLILRFVQPELIYSFRQTLVKIGINKVYLDQADGREGLTPRYNSLLIKDLRYETLGHDSSYALKRINKIRELYSTLDSDRAQVSESKNIRKTVICIVELANLLKNLGENVIPTREFRYPTVKADEILMRVANHIRTSENSTDTSREGVSDLTSDNEVEEWFMENPMSIEQIIEILNAAVFGLAYRQRADEIYESRRDAGSILTTK